MGACGCIGFIVILSPSCSLTALVPPNRKSTRGHEPGGDGEAAERGQHGERGEHEQGGPAGRQRLKKEEGGRWAEEGSGNCVLVLWDGWSFVEGF